MFHPQRVTFHNDGTVTFFKICPLCGKVHNMRVEQEKYERWRHGEHVQNVWPEFSAEARELMISGTCPECFNKLFPPDED